MAVVGKRRKNGKKKEIVQMLEIREGNIAERNLLKAEKIDTIVNAANPTLMRSRGDQGVNQAIHDAIDALEGKEGAFEKMICRELGSHKRKKEIRCMRGKARLTSGSDLCRYVIHVVGAEYDGTSGKKENCSSSRVKILVSCYEEIVDLIKQHMDIRRIAIPIIGSGNYGFPFGLAAQIAIASVANALITWREQDPEMFEMAEIEKVYFFIYDTCELKQRRQRAYADAVLKKYKPVIQKNHKVVFQTSQKAHFRYMKEIWKYDRVRGYFSVARGFRLLLMVFRLAFLPAMWLKDLFGGCDWQRRRQTVELLALVKLGLPLLFWALLTVMTAGECRHDLEVIVTGLVIYNMCDTISYLLTLLIMADIQNPSANLIRSLIMLLVNYMEVSFDMALLYWISDREKLLFREALLYGVLGQEQAGGLEAVKDCVWPYLSAGIQFFFASLVFGYLANHMRQRKFRS